jgi:hypothetical protein
VLTLLDMTFMLSTNVTVCPVNIISWTFFKICPVKYVQGIYLSTDGHYVYLSTTDSV